MRERRRADELASLVAVLFLLAAAYLALAPYPSTRIEVICGSPLLSADLIAGARSDLLAPGPAEDFLGEEERRQECPGSSRTRLAQAGLVAALGVLSYVAVQRILTGGITAATVPALVLVPFVAGALFLAFAPYAPKFNRAYQVLCGSPALSAATSSGLPHGLLAPVAGEADIERLERPLICPTESRGRLVQAVLLLSTGALAGLVARRLLVPDIGHARAAWFVLLPFLAAAVFLIVAPFVPQDGDEPMVCGSPILSASTSASFPDGFLAPGSVGPAAEDFRAARHDSCTTESRGRLVQAAFAIAIGAAAYALARRVLLVEMSGVRVAAVVGLPVVAVAAFWSLSPYTPAETGDPVVVCGVPVVSQARDAGLVPHGFLAPNPADREDQPGESAREDECPPQSRTRLVQSCLGVLLAGIWFAVARHYLRAVVGPALPTREGDGIAPPTSS